MPREQSSASSRIELLRSNVEVMRIKISVKGDYPNADLKQFLGPEQIGDHEFFFNTAVDYADAWFVIEGANPDDSSCVVPNNRVYFLGAETARSIGFFYENPGWLAYLSQFDKVLSPQELYRKGAQLSLPFLPWMINSNHGTRMLDKSERDVTYFRNLESLEKTKQLSVFCSATDITENHRARIRFVETLSEHFGDRLDWFGNGVNPLEQKWDGIADYKYSIVLENQSSSHVLTEKIQDAFLALTVPIYWGAPEAEKLFGRESLLPIDIKNPAGAILAIEELLDADDYENRLSSLRHAKRVVIDEINWMVRILDILNTELEKYEDTPDLKVIRPLEYFTPGKNILDLVHQRAQSAVERLKFKWVRSPSERDGSVS